MSDQFSFERRGKSEMFVTAWTDWHTVIGFREYRDQLLDMKPDSEEDDPQEYRLYFDSADALVAAYNAFRKQNIQCSIGFSGETENRDARVFVQSESFLWREQGDYFSVSVKASNDNLRLAVASAIESLKDALK